MSPYAAVIVVIANRRKLRGSGRSPSDMKQQRPVTMTAVTVPTAVTVNGYSDTLMAIDLFGSGHSGHSDSALWTHIR